MKITSVFIILLSASIVFFGCKKSKGPSVTLRNDVDSVSYALGFNIGSNIKSRFPKVDPMIIAKAIQDVYDSKKDLPFDPASSGTYINNYSRRMFESMKTENLKKGNDFLAKNKNEKGVVTLPSGLQYKVITEGNGPNPSDTSTVKVNYKGTLIDGTVFDSSYDRGMPATFSLKRIIKGWSEALPKMKVGSKWQLFVPPDLAYGDRGAGQSIGPNEVLIFEVELLDIVPPNTQPVK
jgi:FKBP-type peptidyl-prolyl cis-trans isomerase FklB